MSAASPSKVSALEKEKIAATEVDSGMRKTIIAAEAAAGIVILAAAFIYGILTRDFFSHVMFPLGFWLLFEAGDRALRSRSYFGRTGIGEGLALLGLAGLLGVILDYHMVVLTGVLKFYAVRTPGTALQMYFGWAFCLPAIYESYTVVTALLRRPPCPNRAYKTSGRLLRASAAFRVAGPLLVCIPIFMAMWVARPTGWLLILSFTGMFAIMEYVQWRRARVSLLSSTLRGDWHPWAGMALASIPYTLMWEGLNGWMHSWAYRGIFWLEPKVWNVPLVALFGYLFWYVLFLSLLNSLSERDLGVWV